MKTLQLYNEDFESLSFRQRMKWIWYWWTWRLVLQLGRLFGRPYWWNGGRRTDGDPTVCPECRRVFRVRDCVHTYTAVDEDVEGSEECPNCGSEI